MNRVSTWFRNMGLQGKLISAFLLMGLIVFVVGWVGQSGSFRLTQYLDEITEVRLPSIVGVRMLDQGLRVVQAGEMALLNPRLSDVVRQDQLTRIRQALQQIKAGYDQYERLPRTSEEDKIWKSLISKLQRWKQEDEEFLRLYQKFEQGGIFNPQLKQLELIRLAQPDSPDMAAAQVASSLLEQMNVQAFTLNRPAFNSAEQELQNLIQENEKIALAQKQAADESVKQTQLWVWLGMTLGPVTAVILGTVLSLAIAKPLNNLIGGIINEIVSSSTQIAATVEQQELIATEQATAVNQTTTTMDELAASSNATAQQAEAATESARQALALSSEGIQAVQRSQGVMTTMQEKVAAIAGSIVRLSEQSRQIREISGLVSDLASQTNMLALNAAVEAVRAGEHGKGFGVVATEIRKLADISKESAQKINTLVADIQSAIKLTVTVTDEGTLTVQSGVTIAAETAEAFTGVAAAINQIFVNNQQITLTAKQQAIAIQQVVTAMNAINTGAQFSASSITQVKVGTQKLNQAAHNLKVLGS